MAGSTSSTRTRGRPFRLEAGDCVLQPPEIRHRVLRASEGLEVIEIGCPAAHDTFIEHQIELPTSIVRFDRDFGGQRFVHHVASDATRSPWLSTGWPFVTPGSAPPPTVSRAPSWLRPLATQGRSRRADALSRWRNSSSTWCSMAPPISTSTMGLGAGSNVCGHRCGRHPARHFLELGRLERRLRTARGQPARRRRRRPPDASTPIQDAPVRLGSMSTRGQLSSMSLTALPIDVRSTWAMNALSVRWLSTHPGSSAQGGRYFPRLHEATAAQFAERGDRPHVELAGEHQAQCVGPAGDER